MVRATVTTLIAFVLIYAGNAWAVEKVSPDSKAAKEFATQKETVCCFVGMKNLADESSARPLQAPDLSGQLDEARRNLAAKESENADLARQLAAAKAAQRPDLSGQLDEARKNLAAKENENAELARQLAAAKAAQTPDLSGQLDEAKKNLTAKENENAELARQLAAAKAAQTPDLSGQLDQAKKNLASKESENAELARQLAAAKAAQKPDLSSQLDEARRNLAAKESENAELARQMAAMREPREKQAAEIKTGLAEKGSATLHGIFFDFNKSTIKPDSENALHAMEQVLKSDPSLKLEIQGHTDNIGAKEYNEQLSRKRAEAVKSYVIEHFGIEPDRLSATGYGETKPADDNKTAVGRAHNRRVELIKK